MKLFTRYNRVNLLANIAIFLVATAAFYVSIRYVLIHQIDEDLQIEEDEITAFVKAHDRLPESFSVSDQVIAFNLSQKPVNRQFSTIEFLAHGHHKEKYRHLQFGIMAGGKSFRVEVAKSLEETSNLLRSILMVSISTILMILLVSVIINRVLLKKLWQPFYASLEVVKHFRPSKDQPLLLPSTNIDEFSTMNATLESMAQASRLDYLSLKTFSENASHEIQTPIAIIRSKLDLLIQDEDLTESQSKTLQSAYNAVEKLSRLNGSLLLLAKIENRQFEEKATIDLKQKLEEKLQDFQELWQAKELAIKVELKPASIQMNKELVDILLNNLLSNATHHNLDCGQISVQLQQGKLAVCNTSSETELENSQLFQRFYKRSPRSLSNGLGLSIMKQIADVSFLQLHYGYKEGEHCFIVTWSANATIE